MTCRCPNFLPMIRFLSFHVFTIEKLHYNPFIVTSTITWERESVIFLTTYSFHSYSRSIAGVNHGILQIFIKELSGMLDSSMIFLQLCCPIFGWVFYKFIIFSSYLLFTFCVITSSLLSFLFDKQVWPITSVSLDILFDSLSKSTSTITFQI